MPPGSSKHSVDGKKKDASRKRSASPSSHRQSNTHHKAQGSDSKRTRRVEIPLRPKDGTPSSQTSTPRTHCLGHSTPSHDTPLDSQLETAFEKCGPCKVVLDLWDKGARFKHKNTLLEREFAKKGRTEKTEFLTKHGAKFSNSDRMLEKRFENDDETKDAEYLIRHGAKFHELDTMIWKFLGRQRNLMRDFKHENLPMQAKTALLIRQLDNDGKTRLLIKIAQNRAYNLKFVDFFIENGATVPSSQMEMAVDKIMTESGSTPALERLMRFAPEALLESLVRKCVNAIRVAEIDPDSRDEKRSERGMFRPCFYEFYGEEIPSNCIKLFLNHFTKTFEIKANNNNRIQFNQKLMEARSPFFEKMLKYKNMPKDKKMLKSASENKFEESEYILQFVKRYAETVTGAFDWEPIFRVEGIPLERATKDDAAECLDNLLEIMIAANAFGMVDLLNDVQNHTLEYAHYLIESSNVKEVKKIAKAHQAKGLEAYCRAFMGHKENFLNKK